MIIEYYFNNYTRKIISFIMFLNLFFFFNIAQLYASDSELEKINLDDKSETASTKLQVYEPGKNETVPKDLEEFMPNDALDRQLFLSLERLLNKDNFDLMNGRLWLLKAILYGATPFFCGANTLIIAKTGSITAKLILAAQFTVPRTIENICFLIDKGRLSITEGKVLSKTYNKAMETFKHPCVWLGKAPQNKQKIVKAVWSVTRLCIGLYLAYAYSLIDAKTAGDAYRWMLEQITSNSSDSSLTAVDNLGYFFNFCYTALLGAIFFYQLIDEILMRSGLGYLIGICPPATKDLEYEAYMEDIAELRSRSRLALQDTGNIEKNDNQQLDATVEKYLSDRNINSIYNVASLQNCLAAKEKPRTTTTNIAINLFKLFFVAGATVLCGVSFKYIFASGTILRNYVDAVGDEVTEDNYVFKLKSGGNFTCTSVDDCTDGVNFDNIVISDSQKNRLLELNKTADLANILQGVAISADTAVLIISAIGLVYSLATSKLHQRAFKQGLMKKSKIIPAIGAALIFPAMVFYLDNVNNVRPVAKTANRLLESTGQDSFLPVDLGVAATIGVLGATFFLGFRLLSNLPNAIWSTPGKIKSMPQDARRFKSKIKSKLCCGCRS
jgi:hypothetical protein